MTKHRDLFVQINVWRRIDEKTVVIYRLFQDVSSNLYHVQSADSFYLPMTHEQEIRSTKDSMTLFCESQPNKRSKGFKTIKDAINKHDKEFEDL